MNDNTPAEKFEMWARVDLMGHNVRAGKLSVTNTGVEMLYRLDIPTPDGFVTKFFGSGAIYSIDPVSEDAARLIATKLEQSNAPISQWDLPQAWREAMRVAQAKALPAESQRSEYEPIQNESGDWNPDEEPALDDEDDDEDAF